MIAGPYLTIALEKCPQILVSKHKEITIKNLIFPFSHIFPKEKKTINALTLHSLLDDSTTLPDLKWPQLPPVPPKPNLLRMRHICPVKPNNTVVTSTTEVTSTTRTPSPPIIDLTGVELDT